MARRPTVVGTTANPQGAYRVPGAQRGAAPKVTRTRNKLGNIVVKSAAGGNG